MTNQMVQLNQVLRAHKVPGVVVGTVVGPRTVSYHVEMAPGYRVAKFMRLSLEVAISLSAPSVRIYPISKQGVMAVDVPRNDPQTVTFADCALTTEFHADRHLPIMFGLDTQGEPVVGDLVDMPHLLIAGATGSGKSVALNSVLCGLVTKIGPEQMKLMLLDPKGVELTNYRGLAHTILHAVAPMDALKALQSVEELMERRYEKLMQAGYRNTISYNEDVDDEHRLPFLVIVIDELADLILSDMGSAIETSLIRLAQKARASGIHIIAATQRPVVKVVTGLIKVNFPTRLALRVPSQVDSKTILDQPGAERLLGNGDALLLTPGKELLRVQGAYTSDATIAEIIALNPFKPIPAPPSYGTLNNLFRHLHP